MNTFTYIWLGDLQIDDMSLQPHEIIVIVPYLITLGDELFSQWIQILKDFYSCGDICDCQVSPVLVRPSMVRLAHLKRCQVSVWIP